MNWFTRKKETPPPPCTALEQYKRACEEYDAAVIIEQAKLAELNKHIDALFKPGVFVLAGMWGKGLIVKPRSWLGDIEVHPVLPFARPVIAPHQLKGFRHSQLQLLDYRTVVQMPGMIDWIAQHPTQRTDQQS